MKNGTQLGTTGTSTHATILTADGSMRELLAKVARIARSSVPVLVTGETGTGKELLARRIHDESPRGGGPFVAVNCGALPGSLLLTTLFGHVRGAFSGALNDSRGVFQAAVHGTLFLDEVGELSLEAQAALLRALETKTIVRVGATDEIAVDVRIVAATHRNLAEMVDDGRFREDLLYRLATITLELPPLRARTADVALLARSFLAARYAMGESSAGDISAQALARLCEHAWAGNVRELRNVIDHAALMADGPLLEVGDLPPVLSRRSLVPARTEASVKADYTARMHAAEGEILRDALSLSGGRQVDAARLLGMPLRTMKYRLSKLRGRGAASLERHH